MEEHVLYYAYGSNLHPERLRARIPSSRFICVTPLSGYQLCFHKRGEDLSAKCNAAFTGEKEHSILGAVYNMRLSEKVLLDEIEGDGYSAVSVNIKVGNRFLEAFMYAAQEQFIDNQLRPFQWYKDFVHIGALYHQFPGQYIQAITCVDAMVDQDFERQRTNEQVLARMR